MSDSTRYLKGLKAYASTLLRCKQATAFFQENLGCFDPDLQLFQRGEFQAPVELGDPELEPALNTFLSSIFNDCVNQLRAAFAFYVRAATRDSAGTDDHAHQRAAHHCHDLADACWTQAYCRCELVFDDLLR